MDRDRHWSFDYCCWEHKWLQCCKCHWRKWEALSWRGLGCCLYPEASWDEIIILWLSDHPHTLMCCFVTALRRLLLKERHFFISLLIYFPSVASSFPYDTYALQWCLQTCLCRPQERSVPTSNKLLSIPQIAKKLNRRRIILQTLQMMNRGYTTSLWLFWKSVTEPGLGPKFLVSLCQTATTVWPFSLKVYICRVLRSEEWSPYLGWPPLCQVQEFLWSKHILQNRIQSQFEDTRT